MDLRAEEYGAESQVELAAVRAIYAYEEALGYMKGKRTRATGTWQLVNRHGLLPALRKRLQSRNGEDVTPALNELGMDDYSFEAVFQAHPEAFGQQAA